MCKQYTMLGGQMFRTFPCGCRGRKESSEIVTTELRGSCPPTLPASMCKWRCRNNDFKKMFTHRILCQSMCFPCKRRHGDSINRLWVFMLLVFLLFMDVGVQLGQCGTLPGLSSPSKPSLPHKAGTDQAVEDPLARLSKVFGIKRIPGKIVYRTPPQYMTELYDVVADTTGLTKASGPYNANTVRSFPDRDTVHHEHFFYNVSQLQNDGMEHERMLEAEFHVFKMKPRPTRSAEPIPPHHLQLKVYQVLDMENMYSQDGLRLLDVKRISTHAHGWFTFKVSKAVENWRSRSETNHGLLVTAQSSQGQHYNGSYVRFAQRNQHHDSKQPILVVFTDDGSTRHPTYVSPDDQDYQQIRKEMIERNAQKGKEEEKRRHHPQQQKSRAAKPEVENAKSPVGFSRNSDFRQAVLLLNERARSKKSKPQSSSRSRHGKKRRKRETGSGSGSGKKKRRLGNRRKRMYDGYRYRRSCAKHKMYVDFDEIGWSGWIISPKGYDAYHCTGECPFPLGQSQKPTNHATVQSIVHALRVSTKHVGTPCCVPNKLFSISLLYFDDDENVILKQYDDMVAASCGCH